jgi:hypothetical protein
MWDHRPEAPKLILTCNWNLEYISEDPVLEMHLYFSWSIIVICKISFKFVQMLSMNFAG